MELHIGEILRMLAGPTLLTGPWKEILDITLEEHDVLEYVEGEVEEPLKNLNATIKAIFKKGEVKVKNIIFDSLGDHLITHVSKLKKSKEMYDKLI